MPFKNVMRDGEVIPKDSKSLMRLLVDEAQIDHYIVAEGASIV